MNSSLPFSAFFGEDSAHYRIIDTKSSRFHTALVVYTVSHTAPKCEKPRHCTLSGCDACTWTSPTKLTMASWKITIFSGRIRLKSLVFRVYNICSSSLQLHKNCQESLRKHLLNFREKSFVDMDVFSQNQGTADVTQQGAPFFRKKKTRGRAERTPQVKSCVWFVSLKSQSGREVPSPKSQFPGRFSRSSVGFVCLFVCLVVCLLACLLACLFVCLFVCSVSFFFRNETNGWNIS